MVNAGTIAVFAKLDIANVLMNVRKMEDALRKNSEVLKKNAGAFRDFGRDLSLYVSAPLLALGTASVVAATRMDSLKRGLVAVAGSAAEADRQFTRLKEVAKLPGLGMEEAVRGSINLQAAGMSAKLAERSLMAFGNALATVGKGKAELDRVNLALTQLSNKTSGFGQDVRQLQEALPQIRKAMMEAFGTADTEAIGKMGITGAQFVERIVKEFEKLPKVTGGIQNSFENFQDSMTRFLNSLGRVFLPGVGSGLDRLSAAFDKLAGKLEALPDLARTGLGVLFIGGIVMAPVLLAFTTLIEKVETLKKVLAAIAVMPAFKWLISLDTAAIAAASYLLYKGSGPQTPRAQREQQLRLAIAQAGPGPERERLIREFDELDKLYAREGSGGGKMLPKARPYDPFFGFVAPTAVPKSKPKITEHARAMAQAQIDLAREAHSIELGLLPGIHAKFAQDRFQAGLDAEKKAQTAGRPAAMRWLRARMAEIAKEEAEAERQARQEAQNRRETAANRQRTHARRLAEQALRRRNLEHFYSGAGGIYGGALSMMGATMSDMLLRVPDVLFERQERARMFGLLPSAGMAQAGQGFNRLQWGAQQQAQDMRDLVERMNSVMRGAAANMAQMFNRAFTNLAISQKRPFAGVGDAITGAFQMTLNTLEKAINRTFQENIPRAIERGVRRTATSINLLTEVFRAAADEIYFAFAGQLERLFGHFGTIGRIIQVALTRFLSRLLDVVIDSWITEVTRQKPKAEKAQAAAAGFAAGIMPLPAGFPKVPGQYPIPGTIGGMIGTAVGGPIGGLIGGVLGSIFHFQRGGWVPGPVGVPRAAIVHGGEYVVPAGGGSGISVNIANVSMSSEMDVPRVARQLAWHVKQELRAEVGR